MLATVNGITVSGTPEEIQRFRELNMTTATMTNISIHTGNQTQTLQELADKISKNMLQKVKLQGKI